MSIRGRIGGLIEPHLISGAAMIGMDLTRRKNRDAVLGLIRTLRPQDCGIELIRLGGKGDGGYLIPNDLDGIEYCFSPGVSILSDFENQLADLHIQSFLADYSVDGPSISRPEFTFDKKFLGATDNKQFMTLTSWKEKYLNDYTGDLILQMDIEGGEYQVILNTPDELMSQFRILVIEFHSLDKLFDPFAFELLSSCFQKILEPFYVVHLHPNNCCGSVRSGEIEIPRIMEFTFLNKSRVRNAKPCITFPHPLDARNVNRNDLLLPKCWYSSDV